MKTWFISSTGVRYGKRKMAHKEWDIMAYDPNVDYWCFHKSVRGRQALKAFKESKVQ